MTQVAWRLGLGAGWTWHGTTIVQIPQRGPEVLPAIPRVRVNTGFRPQAAQLEKVHGPTAVQMQRFQQRIQFDRLLLRLAEQQEVAERQLLGVAQLQRNHLFEFFVVEGSLVAADHSAYQLDPAAFGQQTFSDKRLDSAR
jgi:hypothetical protein